MIKRTLYFGNPAYLSLKNEQLVIQLQEVEQQIETHRMTQATTHRMTLSHPMSDYAQGGIP
ncbi:MAG: hypothetical protein WAN95_01430 [Bacteroidales bacterium]